MGNVGGNRNYGYGKQLAWAGKNALADRYGNGHYGTRATHEDRWNQFAGFLKSEGINDARKIDRNVLEQYGRHLKTMVNSEEISVAYAQNLLSTVNVVLETMRKDKVLTIKPAQWIGNRSNVRSTVPATVHRHALTVPTVQLHQNGQERVAVIAQLAREFGLRFKEASLLDANRAIRQANRLGRINITQGTKGGRGKGSDRWVPINANNLAVLKQATELQNNERNLIPPDMNYVQWRDHAYNQWRSATKNTAINGFHDMRAAYACERYQAITGHPAPVIAGVRRAQKTLDTHARTIISQELGHNRPDVIAAYVGSGK